MTWIISYREQWCHTKKVCHATFVANDRESQKIVTITVPPQFTCVTLLPIIVTICKLHNVTHIAIQPQRKMENHTICFENRRIGCIESRISLKHACYTCNCSTLPKNARSIYCIDWNMVGSFHVDLFRCKGCVRVEA